MSRLIFKNGKSTIELIDEDLWLIEEKTNNKLTGTNPRLPGELV
jgi:hypothetical protein